MDDRYMIRGQSRGLRPDFTYNGENSSGVLCFALASHRECPHNYLKIPGQKNTIVIKFS